MKTKNTSNSSYYHSIIVNGVVIRNKKILISQRSFKEAHQPGSWTIPGGKVEVTKGNIWNILEKTVKREIEEETGVNIKASIKLLVNNTFIRTNGDHVVSLVFLCHWKSGNARALEDTINIAWITREDISKYEFAPNVKNYIIKCFETIEAAEGGDIC